MKLATGVLILCGFSVSVCAQNQCTPQQALEVLLNDATANFVAERLLVSLKNGVARLRTDLNQTNPEVAAQHIVDNYRSILSYLPKNLAAVVASLGLTAFAYQGRDMDTAKDSLVGETEVGYISKTVLRGLQHDIKNVLQDLENTTSQQIADTLVDRYRVLRGILLKAGISLPLI
ncbi:hypothetical protein IWW39_003088 [Coemansia spiralis]|uniref:Uncharacterized protein n=1 Tax=Coemansia spiralis TaxID=417178 RepID=A0A9W8L4Q2_9FUNG|nr:hypothetical protein IWW39_003088 [Coemansia spiralis]